MALFSIPQLKAAAKIPSTLSTNERTRYATKALRESVQKFSEEHRFDVFLSHKFLEADAALGLGNILRRYGYTVYIDWMVDPHLDRTKTTKHNARLLKKRMENCRCLLVATTPTYKRSVWIPWEVGYVDGVGGLIAVAPVTPTLTAERNYKGNEYFALYPYMVEETIRGTAKKTLWICDSPMIYTRFKLWLNGEEPYPHD